MLDIHIPGCVVVFAENIVINNCEVDAWFNDISMIGVLNYVNVLFLYTCVFIIIALQTFGTRVQLTPMGDSNGTSHGAIWTPKQIVYMNIY